MVKPDSNHDYYADLELPPSCTSDDIKKQFRKLALLYHPDRNLGKEAEYNIKFQAIQTANEVLGDVDSRQKYDATRRRGNVTAKLPKTNPVPGRSPMPTTEFPPPPRRNFNVPPTASSGAERYAWFPSTSKPARASTAKKAAEERQEAFNAWRTFPNPQKTQSQPQRPATRPVAPPYEGPRYRAARSPAEGPEPSRRAEARQRSAWEESNTPRQRPTSARVRSGFDPQTPNGDEAQAPRYTSMPHTDRTDQARMFDGVDYRSPMATAPTAKKADHRAHTKSSDQTPFPEGNRERSPYINRVDERHYFGTNPSPTTTRDQSTSAEPQIARSTARHNGRRSTSPPKQFSAGSHQNPGYRHVPPMSTSRRNSQPHTLSSHNVYSSDDDSEGGSPLPKGTTRSQARRKSSQGSGEASSTSEIDELKARPKARPSQSWTNRRQSSSLNRAKSMEDKSPGIFDGVEDQQPRPMYERSPTSHEHFDNQYRRVSRTLSSLESQTFRDPLASSSPHGEHGDDSRANAVVSDVPRGDYRRPSLLMRSNTVYGFPIRRDSFQRASTPDMRSKSGNDNINNQHHLASTQPTRSPGTEPISNVQPSNGVSAGTTPANITQKSREQHATFQGSPISPDSQTDAFSRPKANDTIFWSNENTFSADAWARKLQQENLSSKLSAGPPTMSTPPRIPPNPRRARGTTSPRPPFSTTASKIAVSPKPVSVTDVADEEAGIPSNHGSVLDDADNAMDIDTPPQESRYTPSTTEDISLSTPILPMPLQTARGVFVEPTKPEWRDSNTGGLAEIHGPPPRRSATNSRSTSTNAFNLADLSTAPPLAASTGSGLRNLTDLATNLPFPSMASSAHPTAVDEDNDDYELALPQPPKAPMPPTRPTQIAWATYLASMAGYLKEWHHFNADMLAKLAEHATFYRDMDNGTASGTVEGWLGAVGETGKLGGWGRYKRMCREDEVVRVHWSVAAERHRDAVERHEGVRNRVLGMGLLTS